MLELIKALRCGSVSLAAAPKLHDVSFGLLSLSLADLEAPEQDEDEVEFTVPDRKGYLCRSLSKVLHPITLKPPFKRLCLLIQQEHKQDDEERDIMQIILCSFDSKGKIAGQSIPGVSMFSNNFDDEEPPEREDMIYYSMVDHKNIAGFVWQYHYRLKSELKLLPDGKMLSHGTITESASNFKNFQINHESESRTWCDLSEDVYCFDMRLPLKDIEEIEPDFFGYANFQKINSRQNAGNGCGGEEIEPEEEGDEDQPYEIRFDQCGYFQSFFGQRLKEGKYRSNNSLTADNFEMFCFKIE